MGWVIRYFGFLAAGVSFALLLGAHGFEMAGYQPCELCMQQRQVHWVALVIGLAAGLASLRRSPGALRKLLLAALAVTYLAGVAIAGQHVAVEQKWIAHEVCPSPDGGPHDKALHAALQALATPFGYEPQSLSGQLAARLSGTLPPPPACDEPSWWWLGLTMAGWNLIACLGLATLSGLAAWRRLRR